jgi:hypothetical protein
MDVRSTDDTFASTLAGISKLRAEHGGDEDWKEWRRTVLAAVTAGEHVEREVAKLVGERERYARQAAQDEIRRRVERLEGERASARNVRSKLWRFAGKIGLVVAGALSARVFH